LFPVRILNLDQSVIQQTRLITQYHPEVINLVGLGPESRFWMNQATRRVMQSRLSQSSTGRISFLGSGDFHHLSQLLLELCFEDFVLIVFDLHPDWDSLPPRFACGAWVSQSLKNINILQAILLGVSSEDISTGGIQSADLSLLENNRLQIYPYSHQPTRTFFKPVPQNSSLAAQKSLFSWRIVWQELKSKDLTSFTLNLVKCLPVKRVYLSIDKDCLKKEYALTNWEEGKFSLDELLLMLKIIKENTELLGVDICGDYSPVAIRGKWKNFCSRLDHPKDFTAKGLPESVITATNESTNLKILQVLNS